MCSVAVLAWNFFFGGEGGHGPMASAVHEPVTGVWGRSPQWGPRAEHLLRESGG